MSPPGRAPAVRNATAAVVLAVACLPLAVDGWTASVRIPSERRWMGLVLPHAVGKARLVVAISAFTARDLHERLHVPERRIRIGWVTLLQLTH